MSVNVTEIYMRCHPIKMPVQSQRVYPFSNLVLEESGWSASCPDCFTPAKEFQYPLYWLGGPQGWYEWVQKISPPTRIHSLGHVAPSILLHQLCYPSLFLQYIHQYLSWLTGTDCFCPV